MSRFNNFVKFNVKHVNFFFAIIGLSLIGIALYLIFADWKALAPGFFLGSGICTLLFGLILTTVSYIGNMGVNHQTKISGFWTGRKILTIYQVVLVASLAAEGYMLSISLNTIKEFKVAYASLTNGVYIPYAAMEEHVAEKFNMFFFGATTGCLDPKFAWFWSWINSNCPQDYISQLWCERCDDYSVTLCYADEKTCLAPGDNGVSACPYEICRVGVVSYFVNNLKPFSYFVLAFTSFQCYLILLNCMLICYSKRDSLDVILYKAGTISTKPTNTTEQMVSDIGED